MKKIQATLLKAVVPLVSVADAILLGKDKPGNNDQLVRQLIDSVALITHANADLRYQNTQT